MTLLTRIKMLCVQNNTTISKLEKKLDFGNGTISRWDTATPSGERLAKVAEEFNVSVDYLLGIKKNATDNADIDIRRIQRARQKMPSEDKDFMMKILTRSFKEYFEDDGSDDPD